MTRFTPRLRAGAAACCAAAGLLAGCAGPAPAGQPLGLERGAAAFAGRSLADPGLHAYLRENLGGDPAAWDFEALCWAGFYYQPALEAARAQWEAAKAAERTAGERPNPALTLTPGYDFTRQAGVSPWMPSISADILLAAPGKVAVQQRKAAAEAEAARLSVASAAWQLRSELRKALLEAQGADRRARVLRRQAAAQRRLAELLEQRLRAGSVSAPEAAAARIALLRSENAAADAAAQLAAARSHAAAAIGVPAAALDGVALPAAPVPPPLAPAELAAARRRALQSRPDVLAALAKYAAADAALALELRKRFPDVHLGPAYQYDQGLNKWSLGLTFELPIFNRNAGPIAEASARRDEAAAQFNVVQNQATAAIDAAAAAMNAAAAQLQRAQALQAETEAQARLAEQRQAAGAADAVDAASAEAERSAAEGAVLDAESAAASAAGELEDALQLPFEHFEAVLKHPDLSQPHSAAAAPRIRSTAFCTA